RRETWEANRWIARSITEAFSAANDCFTAAQKGFPYATPWLEAELEETNAVMGEDFHPYGLARNRAQIDTFAAEAFRLGLTSRRVPVDESFAAYLLGACPRRRLDAAPARSTCGYTSLTFLSGKLRTGLPVAAKIALRTAGVTTEIVGSPTPPQKSWLGTITVSTLGISARRRIW